MSKRPDDRAGRSRSELSRERLLAYASGQLSGEDRAQIESELTSDPVAASMLRRIQAVQTTLREDDSTAPPEDLITKAQAIGLAGPAMPRPRPRWWDRVDVWIASLVFDSRLHATGARFSGDEDRDDHFQLSYESEAADVELQASRHRSTSPAGSARSESVGHWRLMGQVAADVGADQFRISLHRNDLSSDSGSDAGCSAGAPGSREAVRETLTDGKGVFEMDVDPGTYDLRVEVADRVMVLPGILMT